MSKLWESKIMIGKKRFPIHSGCKRPRSRSLSSFLFRQSVIIISTVLNPGVSPWRFLESITRRSYNVFVVCVAGDIVATATNKAQTDGWTDRRMDRRRCIFRLSNHGGARCTSSLKRVRELSILREITIYIYIKWSIYIKSRVSYSSLILKIIFLKNKFQ